MSAADPRINPNDGGGPIEYYVAGSNAHHYARDKFPLEYEHRENSGSESMNSKVILAVTDAYREGFLNALATVKDADLSYGFKKDIPKIINRMKRRSPWNKKSDPNGKHDSQQQ